MTKEEEREEVKSLIKEGKTMKQIVEIIAKKKKENSSDLFDFLKGFGR